MNFQEKSIFIWQDKAIEGGDPSRILSRLKLAGFEAALLHAVSPGSWRTPTRIKLAKALQDGGITVYGSAAIYGDVPAVEGTQAASIVKEYSLAGFVFDAETAFDEKATPDSNAAHVLRNYKTGTDKPCAWCWWARYKNPNPNLNISWHPVSVLRTAMQYADVGMPMAYWYGSSPQSAVGLINETFKQWRAITQKPIVPAGRAYTGDDGTATPDAIRAFESRARELGAPGVTWWSMQHASADVWFALSTLPIFGESKPEEPKPLTLEERVAALEARVHALESK